MNSNIITINQTLHGYVDGHTLIASSLELPPEVRRLMLLLSDMSGSRMEKGFEEYITGYPLKEINQYAIAKTWYAPEMKRPGCVWTQTILIDFADVPKVSDIQSILACFTRPESIEVAKQFYDKTLTVNNAENDFIERDINTLNITQTGIIVNNLYRNAEKPLLVKANSSKNFDKLFLLIWRQQWPRLKRNFSFCTGAISPRNIRGEMLDLQVVPYSTDMSTTTGKDVIVVTLDANNEQNGESWLNFAVDDLFAPTPNVRSFLNYFGSDVSIKRSSFKSLIETYIFFASEKPPLDRCISFLAKQYPSPKEANNLKIILLGHTKSPFGALIPKYDENAILFYLTTTAFYDSFDYEKLNYRLRFIEFFGDHQEQAVTLLKKIVEDGPNPNGEEVITKLAETSGDNKYLDSIWRDKRLLSIFINLNPKLTLNRSFWISNQNNQGEIINQLQKINLGSDSWQKILSILLEIRSPIDPNIFENENVNVVATYLDRYNRRNIEEVQRNWTTYLKSHSTEVLDWFTINQNIKAETVELITSILNPNSKLVVHAGVFPWVNYLNKINSDKKHLIKIDVHAFCLALAFNVDDFGAQEIFESSFEIVYFALAAESLDFQLWRNIELHTKPLSFWKDWDKCKKLINALVDFYIKNDWPIKPLTQIIHGEELKDRILSQYKKRK